jgi:O-antigen/teichoic acid export membrane protein
MVSFNKLASSALLFYIGTSCALGLGLILLAPRLAAIFAVSGGYYAQAVFLIRCYAPGASVLTLVGTVFAAVLTSANRFDQLNIITSKVYALRAVALIVVLKTTHLELYGWALVTLGAEVVRVLLLRREAVRIQPTFRLRLDQFSLPALYSLATLGVVYFGAQSARLLGAQSDPFVLSYYFGPAILALYTPSVHLLSAVRPFVVALQDQLYPVTTEFHERNDHEKVANVLTSGTRYIVLLAAGVTALLAGFSDSIMDVWVGHKLGSKTGVAGVVLCALAFVELTHFCSGTQWPVLLGKGRLKIYLYTALPGGVAYLITSLLLVGGTGLGVYGVLIPNVVINVILRLVIVAYTARLCFVSLTRYAVESYLRPGLVFAILLLICSALNRAIRPSSYSALALCSLGVFTLWVSLAWFLGFNGEDRLRMTRVLRSVVDRGNKARLGSSVPSPQSEPSDR